MGRFDPKYSREQKDAAVRALVEERIQAPDVVRLAKIGQLEGLDPFDLNLETARSWRHQEQRKRGLKADYRALDAEENLGAIANDSAAWLRRHLGRLLAKPNPTNADIDRIQRLSRAGREVQALAKGAGRSRVVEPKPEPSNELDNVTRMMRALDARSEPNGPLPKHSVQDGSHLPRSNRSTERSEVAKEAGRDAALPALDGPAKHSA